MCRRYHEAMSTQTLKLIIHGASGRMGQALLRLAADADDLQVVAAVSGRTPAQRVVDGVPQFAASELPGLPPFDVAIDFSLPDGVPALAALCAERRAGLVCGTTGLQPAGEQALAALAAVAPLVWASNYSLGVAVLTDLVARAAQLLDGWDLDIVESHHVHKLDAPSGTALSLGKAAQAQGALPRYASLRAGDIVGEHTVQFAGLGERIELVHRATNRDIFARGALLAARRLHGRAPGRYSVAALLTG